MIEAFLANPYSVIGVFLLACFAAYLAWRNGHKVRSANACATFRSAVLAELGSIYPSTDKWPDNIDAFLRSHVVALQTAVENFRPFVPWWEKWCFNRAWTFYLKGKKGVRGQYQNYWQYVSHGSTDEKGFSRDNHLTYKQNFKRNIARLLSYAKET